jgi:hypothetical protein
VNNRLETGLQNENVAVVDFTPTAIAHNQYNLDDLYFANDGHSTALGHKLAAK